MIWAGIKQTKKKKVAIGKKFSPLLHSQGSFIVFIFLINTGSKEGRKNYFGKLLGVCYKESPWIYGEITDCRLSVPKPKVWWFICLDKSNVVTVTLPSLCYNAPQVSFKPV